MNIDEQIEYIESELSWAKGDKGDLSLLAINQEDMCKAILKTLKDYKKMAIKIDNAYEEFIDKQGD